MKTLALCAVLCAVLFAQSSNLENRNASSFTVNTGADATVGLQVLQHSATQSANLQNWSDSSGTPLTSIGPTGLIVGPSGVGGSQRLGDFTVSWISATRLHITGGSFLTQLLDGGDIDIAAGVGTGTLLFYIFDRGPGALIAVAANGVDSTKISVTGGTSLVVEPDTTNYSTANPLGAIILIWPITADAFNTTTSFQDTRSFIAPLWKILAGNGITIVEDALWQTPGALNISATSPFPNGSLVFAALGTPADGVQTYCSDCTVVSGIDNTCANTGTGAMAFRINGAWKCEQ
jgi:hypothetical protein